MSDFITNAELRIEAERLCDENDQLKAENAKLKELLLKSFVLVKNNEPRLVSDRMAKRMRELGIEVPDV